MTFERSVPARKVFFSDSTDNLFSVLLSVSFAFPKKTGTELYGSERNFSILISLSKGMQCVTCTSLQGTRC
jgi:hypothetical protein